MVCYYVHNISSFGKALYLTLGSFQYPPTGTVRSGPSVPSGLSLQRRTLLRKSVNRASWLPRTIPRCRPIAYQAIALPLSYGAKKLL